jgi:protoporphyrinogen oxidase
MQFHRADEISAGALVSLLYEMMSEGRKYRVAYTSGGMGEIPKALAKNLNIKYSTEINSIDELRNNFDAVIIATTAPVALKLISDISPKQKKYFEHIGYSTTSVVTFKIPANIFTDHALFTYVPFVENQMISGYDNTVQKCKTSIENGISLLNIYLHESAIKKLEDKTDAEYFELVKTELAKVCPEAKKNWANVTPYKICRWEKAMPKFTGAHIAATREFLKTEQGKNNIFFAGDYLNSPWAEGAARNGVHTARAVLAAIPRE